MAKPRKNQKIRLEGADELNAAFDKLASRTGGILLAQAAAEGAKVLVNEAKRRAPVDTGTLRDGIQAQPTRLQQGRAQFAIGVSKRTWYGQLIEKGTRFIAARPFLRPSLDTKAQEATDKVGEVLKQALKDVL
jgi:HK97 gp10 family phage protein